MMIHRFALLSVFVACVSFAPAAFASGVQFADGESYELFQYLKKSEVPLSVNRTNLRVYSLRSAGCAYVTIHHGITDDTSLKCTMSVSSGHGEPKVYEGDNSLWQILDDVAHRVYGTTEVNDNRTAYDLTCQAVRDSSEEWAYSCSAASI